MFTHPILIKNKTVVKVPFKLSLLVAFVYIMEISVNMFCLM